MEFYGSLLKEIVQLFASLGDVIMGALNKFMLGSDEFFSAMLSQGDVNLEQGSGSWLVENIDGDPDVEIDEDYMDDKTWLIDASDYQIPNMLYSPESIFANNIAMLDINFLKPNTYTPIIDGLDSAINMSQSSAGGTLQVEIANWYKSFRNIAIVSLLSMLVYLGIRILISSTAGDKAKYKEALKNWLVALCLVFVIHFIMSGILMITENFNALFSKEIDEGILVEATPSDESTPNSGSGKIRFRTNLVGLARFKAQADAWQDATAYSIIYLALVIYTGIFTFIYFKRFLYMAFFTMIAPLVALTYPIDKAGDGKAQAFNIWFKEYTMNAIIQPVHLILYTVFVKSATDLAVNNPIYALVAIAFLIPAEKFIKKMFGLDKAESAGGFASFAGVAMAMKGLQTLADLGGKKSGKSSSGNGKDSLEDNGKIRFNKTNSSAANLDTFNQRSSSNNPENARIADSTASNHQDMGGQNEISNQQEATAKQSSLQDTRDEWERIANDENASDLDREEARQQLEMIDEDLGIKQGDSIGDTSLGQPEMPEMPENPENSDKWAKLKTVGRAGLSVGKIAGAKAWKGLKFTGKALTKTTGAVGGATLGLAAGLTTGDMSKAISFATTGAAAGGMIGSNLADMPGAMYSGTKKGIDKARNSMDSMRDKFNTDVYGYEYARDKRNIIQNNRSLNQLYKNKEELEKARDLAGQLHGFKGNEKDILKAKADYYAAGITDEKLINNAIKASYKEGEPLSGQRHQEYISLAAHIDKGGYTSKDIRDEKSMMQMEEKVQANVKDPYVQKEVMTKMSDLLGEKNLYENRSKEGKTRIHTPPVTRNVNKQNRENQ